MWSISEYIGSADSTVTSSTTSRTTTISPRGLFGHRARSLSLIGLNGSANSLTEVLDSNLSNQASLLGYQVSYQDLPVDDQDRDFSMLDVYGLAESITELYEEIFYSTLSNPPVSNIMMGIIGSAESLEEVFELLEDLCYLIDQALTA